MGTILQCVVSSYFDWLLLSEGSHYVTTNFNIVAFWLD